MKPIKDENKIVSFIDTLIEKYGFTFHQSKFNYICEHEFNSSLDIRKDGENLVNLTIIANDIIDEIWLNISYDLRSDGSYWKGKKFKYSFNTANFSEVESFIKEIA